MLTTTSKISVYIGLPAHQLRSVQSDLGRIVADVLNLTHQRVEDRSRNRVTFAPIIKGASAYSTPFGFNANIAGAHVPIDNHTEVVEFLAENQNFSPVLFLVFSEVVYPAMFLASQPAVLSIVQHDEHTFHINHTRICDIPNVISRGQYIDPQHLDPITFLNSMLKSLIVCERGALPYFSEQGTLRIEFPLAAQEPSFPNYDSFSSELRRWLVDQGDLNLQKRNWHDGPDLNLESELHYNINGPYVIKLPTIYLRLLLNAGCWWLFYSASTTLRNTAQGLGKLDGEYWGVAGARHLQEVFSEVLHRIETVWFSNERPDSYVKTFGVGADSEDPLTNAVLWFAYLRDFLHWCVPTDLGSADAPTRTDPLSEALPTDSAVHDTSPRRRSDTERHDLRFDKLATSPQLRGQLDIGLLEQDPDNVEYWRVRLNVLASVNDCQFPDSALLSAWKLFFRLLRKPGVRLEPRPVGASDSDSREYSTLAWSDKAMSFRSVEEEAAEKPGIQAHADWWVETARMWETSPATARMWLSPVLIEAIHNALLSISDPEKSVAASLQKAFMLASRHPGENLRRVYRMTNEAALAFPLSLPQTSFNNPAGLINLLRARHENGA